MPDVESSRLAHARPLFAMMMPARVTFESIAAGFTVPGARVLL
jgi:hypothetical protein